MANIKWTGIEQWKYGLTARWYVDAYYGNDVDVDAVGYYNPSTNPTGHGGPTRPFASLGKVVQDANVLSQAVVVIGSGYYTYSTALKSCHFVGDGIVIFNNINLTVNSLSLYNLTIISSNVTSTNISNRRDIDCRYFFCTNLTSGNLIAQMSSYLNCSFNGGSTVQTTEMSNCIFISCSHIGTSTGFRFSAANSIFKNNIIHNSPNLAINLTSLPINTFIDWSIIFGTISTGTGFTVNGKTSGVTIEDFKIDGRAFIRSYSAVDLFGLASGSVPSVAQLQTVFNNYFSPVYLDTWQNLDLSLKPNADDRIKFGGLNGEWIGIRPVGYRFSAYDLWNTYKDNVNSSNIDWNSINNGIIISAGQDVGTYRSIKITLPTAVTVDPVNFFANIIYNADGTPKGGVANQRIDTTVDMLPDNTKNQRVVYDYKLQYSPTEGGALTTFKNFELNTPPFVDNSGNSNLDDAYNAAQRQKIVIRDFIIEFTLRRVIIE